MPAQPNWLETVGGIVSTYRADILRNSGGIWLPGPFSPPPPIGPAPLFFRLLRSLQPAEMPPAEKLDKIFPDRSRAEAPLIIVDASSLSRRRGVLMTDRRIYVSGEHPATHEWSDLREIVRFHRKKYWGGDYDDLNKSYVTIAGLVAETSNLMGYQSLKFMLEDLARAAGHPLPRQPEPLYIVRNLNEMARCLDRECALLIAEEHDNSYVFGLSIGQISRLYPVLALLGVTLFTTPWGLSKQEIARGFDYSGQSMPNGCYLFRGRALVRSAPAGGLFREWYSHEKLLELVRQCLAGHPAGTILEALLRH